MKRYLIYAVLSVTLLIARENPFKPVVTPEKLGATTLKKERKKEFTGVKINLPSSARILKSVEVEYQNLDGSIESKAVKIDRKIDWHDTLVLKKLKDETTPKTKEKKKEIPKKVSKVKTIKFKNTISFQIKNSEIILKTKDKKLRDFMVTSPYKIVVDFKKELSFYTKVYNLNLKKFKKITIGKHSGYYRVAIELDGQYIYEIKKVKNGYAIYLK